MKILRLLICMCLVLVSQQAMTQVGLGFTISDDLYNVYSNERDGIAHRRNGTVLLSPAIGPKIWVGADQFSLSVEAQANLGLLGLAVKDYKGLGSLSFPIMAKLNFGGLSGLNKDMAFGWSIGGGLQYSKTEIYGLSQEYADLGVTRDYFKTYNVQFGAGMGISGFTGHAFARWGYNPDLDGANNFHFGLQMDFNLIKMKKIKRPESEL